LICFKEHSYILLQLITHGRNEHMSPILKYSTKVCLQHSFKVDGLLYCFGKNKSTAHLSEFVSGVAFFITNYKQPQ